jgi:hypothetical protein
MPSEFQTKNPLYYLESRSIHYSIHLRFVNGGIFYRRPMYFTSSAWTFIHQQHKSPYLITLHRTDELYNAYSQHIIGCV